MRAPGFVTRNFRLKIACTIIALVTWVGVVYASNPPETRVVGVSVPQQQSSIPPRFQLVRGVPDLAVRIGGARDHLDSFNPASLSVSVAWNRVTAAGTQAISITVANSDPNVELVDPPTSITADLDYIDSTTVTVTIEVTTTPPPGYTIGPEAAQPATVVVSGPHHELAGVQARVLVDLGNNKTNFKQTLPVFIYDARGDRLNDLTVTAPPGSSTPPGKVDVTILVSANITSRASAVRPRTTGALPAGHVLLAMNVSPLTVVLSGPQNLLNALDFVSTTPISLNGVTGDETFSVTVTPPAGVTAQPTTVAVTLIVGTLATPTPSPSPTASP